MSNHCSSGSGNANKTNSIQEPEDEGGIKDPKPLDYLFEKELINKRNKHIYVVDDFVPSKNTHHITAKFYARHQQYEPEKQFEYRSFVQRPEILQNRTENNVYGWMPPTLRGQSATILLSQLNFVSAPKQRCCLTVYGEALQSDQITGRPPFNGLRFFLQ